MGNEKIFELSLGVYKVGDDLAGHLEQANNDPKEGFMRMAKQYEEAAMICKRMAGIASESNLKVAADCHFVSITGTDARLDALANEGILYDVTDEYNEVIEYAGSKDDYDDYDDYQEPEDDPEYQGG